LLDCSITKSGIDAQHFFIGIHIALREVAARCGQAAPVFRWGNHPPDRPATGRRESL